jgi:hypothetical protein
MWCNSTVRHFSCFKSMYKSPSYDAYSCQLVKKCLFQWDHKVITMFTETCHWTTPTVIWKPLHTSTICCKLLHLCQVSLVVCYFQVVRMKLCTCQLSMCVPPILIIVIIIIIIIAMCTECAKPCYVILSLSCFSLRVQNMK